MTADALFGFCWLLFWFFFFFFFFINMQRFQEISLLINFVVRQ